MKRVAYEITGIMIDLNGFKTINDRFGHTVGDEAIVEAARRFGPVLRRMHSRPAAMPAGCGRLPCAR